MTVPDLEMQSATPFLQHTVYVLIVKVSNSERTSQRAAVIVRIGPVNQILQGGQTHSTENPSSSRVVLEVLSSSFLSAGGDRERCLLGITLWSYVS